MIVLPAGRNKSSQSKDVKAHGEKSVEASCYAQNQNKTLSEDKVSAYDVAEQLRTQRIWLPTSMLGSKKHPMMRPASLARYVMWVR